jgi:hypothetical protein
MEGFESAMDGGVHHALDGPLRLFYKVHRMGTRSMILVRNALQLKRLVSRQQGSIPRDQLDLDTAALVRGQA